MSPSRILVIVTGSIAAYKACDLISQLVQAGHEVQGVLTDAARQFVGAATIEGLTGRRVASGLFAEGAALEHIELPRWAEVVVVCPATANFINRCAAGLGDDLAGTCFLARAAGQPWIFAPAMNPAMWAHPATRASVARLEEWGITMAPVDEGRTACGEVGAGRLGSVAAIRELIATVTGRQPRGRVLITSGGTSEPIDAVRVLTNTSTGGTGARLARHFHAAGWQVTLLRSASATAVPAVEERVFRSFADLARELFALLADRAYDLVIHAAAVGDFAVDRIEIDGQAAVPGGGKIDSHAAPVLHLRPQPKLLEALRGRSRNPRVRIVAFKLLVEEDLAKPPAVVASWLAAGTADAVVVNAAQENQGGDAFPAVIHAQPGGVVARCATREQLARELTRWAAEFLPHDA